jgi:hypothetical protein
VSEIFETDRSGILSMQKCPRDRYYSRHFGGNGIERLRKSLPLVFGSAFHIGTEPLLRGEGIEVAVAAAINHLDLAFSAEGVDLEEKQTAYAVEEQKVTAEGLLRAWWGEKGQRFLDEFEVLEVEQEGRAELAPGVVLMFRPDALVREKLTGDLYIVSWKTASTFGAYTLNSIQTDMQSMSEVWGVQEQNKHLGQSELSGDVLEFGPRIEGALYLFAVKGQRRMDDYLGFKVQDTPLAYGWVKKGVPQEEDEWAFRYKWASEEEGRKFQQLPKGFRKVPIWSDYPGGVKAWIDALAAREITPRHINPFEAIFPESLPVSRRSDEIESWRRQVVSQESRVRQRVKAVEEAHGDEEVLDREFPQHTANCYNYNSPCSFFDVCFKPAVKADPLGSGLYKIRQANHPEKGSSDAE